MLENQIHLTADEQHAVETFGVARPQSLLIGLHGPKGAGKDTVGDFLADDLGFTAISFADPMRGMVAALLTGMELADDDLSDVPCQLGYTQWRLAHNREFKESVIPGLGVTPRRLLETLGTEWGRALIAVDLWERVALARINKIRERYGQAHIVITDVRFRSEAELIRARGGVIWHITRPGYTFGGGHESDHPLPDELIDSTIDNNADIKQLRHTVLRSLRKAD